MPTRQFSSWKRRTFLRSSAVRWEGHAARPVTRSAWPLTVHATLRAADWGPARTATPRPAPYAAHAPAPDRIPDYARICSFRHRGAPSIYGLSDPCQNLWKRHLIERAKQRMGTEAGA